MGGGLADRVAPMAYAGGEATGGASRFAARSVQPAEPGIVHCAMRGITPYFKIVAGDGLCYSTAATLRRADRHGRKDAHS